LRTGSEGVRKRAARSEAPRTRGRRSLAEHVVAPGRTKFVGVPWPHEAATRGAALCAFGAASALPAPVRTQGRSGRTGRYVFVAPESFLIRRAPRRCAAARTVNFARRSPLDTQAQSPRRAGTPEGLLRDVPASLALAQRLFQPMYRPCARCAAAPRRRAPTPAAAAKARRRDFPRPPRCCLMYRLGVRAPDRATNPSCARQQCCKPMAQDWGLAVTASHGRTRSAAAEPAQLLHAGRGTAAAQRATRREAAHTRRERASKSDVKPLCYSELSTRGLKQLSYCRLDANRRSSSSAQSAGRRTAAPSMPPVSGCDVRG
jgi:hypothetical protein